MTNYEGVVDKVMFFIAPKIIGGKASISVVGGDGFRSLNDAIMIDEFKTRKIGDDILVEGMVQQK